MKQKYSEAFIAQAVVKLHSRGKRTVREIVLEINVSYHTAKNWMARKSPGKAGTSLGKEKRPQDWNAQVDFTRFNRHLLRSKLNWRASHEESQIPGGI